MESYYYKQRGCQDPWNSFSDLGVPICTNYEEIKQHANSRIKSFGASREYHTNAERIYNTKSECAPPCNVTTYDLKYEEEFVSSLDKWLHGWNRSLKIAFAEFVVEHKDEYLACDITCIIGEVGGNLGFFLGGSILMFFDIIIEQLLCCKAFLQKHLASRIN